MLSLALDPHLVASVWERVGGSIYSGLGEEEASAVNLDLSGIEASFGVHRAASNSLGCTTFPPDVYEVGSINKKCIPLSKTATPSTMNCWQSMVQVDLSGSHSPHSGIQQPCNSDGEETMRVPETVADQNDNSSGDPGSVEGQQGALSTACKSQVDADAASIEDADAASTDDASGQLVQPQLSRANSLSGALRDVPSTPLEPSNSGTSSTESDNSCADLSGSAASAAENTAPAVQCIAPTAGVEQKNKSGAAESKAPLCPKAAMAAATAALQRRLLEQQKMGKLLLPGATAASISVLGVQQQSAKIESQQREDATLPCETQTAAVPAAPAAAPVSKLAGIKRDFSALCWQKPASAAAARQLLQHKCPASHAASAGSVGEVFVRTRGEALARYREKRARRSHAKKIRYHLRKVNADKRPRIKGRFVSKEEMEKMGLLAPHLESANDCCTGQEQSAVLMGEHHGELKIAARAAATAAVGCPWEEQMQHMHLMGADMAAELLQKFDDVVDDHQHQLLAVANGMHVALEAVLEGASDHPAESEHMLLPPVLEYPGECGLTAAGHEEMPQLPMDFAASDALCLGFHEDFLNDEASEASNHHHDFLML